MNSFFQCRWTSLLYLKRNTRGTQIVYLSNAICSNNFSSILGNSMRTRVNKSSAKSAQFSSALFHDYESQSCIIRLCNKAQNVSAWLLLLLGGVVESREQDTCRPCKLSLSYTCASTVICLCHSID